MTTFIDTLLGNAAVLTIAVILSILIIFASAKRLIRLLLLLVAVAVLYATWLTWRGDNVGDMVDKAKQTAKDAGQKGKSAVKTLDRLMQTDEERKP
ncbi:MAG: hypothetical protein HGB01_05460 [Chlorobiaceae bacterium]|nr:hypothetical protein [Chlorobiales bacterium]NTU91320.1 hypothetical protein [Chlorobiaceae bacterium]NTV25640.1 hypothetical protein [Chlorobiaceae bacterium]